MSQFRFTSPALLKKLDDYQPIPTFPAAASQSASVAVEPFAHLSALPVLRLAPVSQGDSNDTATPPQLVHASGAGNFPAAMDGWSTSGRHAFEVNTQYRYFQKSQVMVKLVPW